MADNQNLEGQQITSDDFVELRPWTTYRNRDQHLTMAYRQPKYRIDPDDDRPWLDKYRQEIYRKDAQSGQLVTQYRLARLVFEAGERVDYLETMADTRHRQVATEGPGIADDLRGRGLDQWQMVHHINNILYSLFSRCLYVLRQSNLRASQGSFTPHDWWTFFDTHRWDRLMHNLRQVESVERIQRRRLNNGTGTLRPGYKWIWCFRQSVLDAHQSMVAAWSWAQQEGGSFAGAVNHVWNDIPEMTRLLMVLLEREKTFDDLMCTEHIFCCLFDKRVKLFKGKDLSFLHDFLTLYNAQILLPGYFTPYDHLTGLYNELGHQQSRLKMLFDYKSIMDWNRTKMWKPLHIVINPDLRISELTVAKFTNWVAAQNDDGGLAQNLFGARPLTKGRLEPESCSICLEGYVNLAHEIGSVVIETTCGHFFHPECLVASWDSPGRFQNRCPNCRHSAGRLADNIANVRYQDREFEEPGIIQMNDIWCQQVEDAIDQGNPTSIFSDDILDVWWGIKIEDEVLRPMRETRIANRPTWGTVLGESK